MSIASSPIPAGWYPDPAGSFQQRWWTGDSWTNDFAQYRPTLVHSAPVAETLSEAAEPLVESSPVFLQRQAAEGTSAAQADGHQGGSSTPTQTMTRQSSTAFAATPVDSTPVAPTPVRRLPDDDQPPQTTVAQPNAGNVSLIAVAPSNQTAAFDAGVGQQYMPFGFSRGQQQQGYIVTPDRRYTAAVWLLALLPAVSVAVAYALATLVPQLYTTLTQVLIIVLFLALSVVLAAVDRRVLRADGHVSMASPAFALLTPLAFLSVRTALTARETDRNTVAPLILLLLVVAGIVAALVLVPGMASLLLTATALY